LVFIFISVTARAGLKVWSGETALWNDESQWTPTGVPTSSDDVLVTNGQAVVRNGDGTCASFVVTNMVSTPEGFLIVNDTAHTLQVVSNGVVNGTGAYLRVNLGHLDVGGSVTLLNDAHMVIADVAATATVHSLDLRDGNLDWNAGTLRFTDDLWLDSGEPISNLTVAAGRTLEVISPTIFAVELTVGNAGTLTLTGGDVICDAFTKTSTGTFEFVDGTLTVNGEGFDWDNTTLNLEGTASINRPTLVLNDFYLPLKVTLTNGIAIAPSADRQGHLKVINGSNLEAPATLAGGIGAFGDVTVTNGATWTASTLTVGDEGTGTLTIEDNSRVQGCTKIEVGRNGTATGIVTVAGAGSQWNGYWQSQIGGHGVAILDVTDGGSVLFDAQIADTEFARYSGSRAEVSVSGSNSQFRIKSDAYSHTIYFGLSGHASLTVSNGASVIWDEFTRLGETSGSHGDILVTGSNSSWTVDDDLWMGYEGNGSLQVLDGGVAHTDAAKLGEYPGGVGQVTISGAGSVWHGGGEDSIGGEFLVGRYGTGEITVEKGGVLYSSGLSMLGYYSGSRGYVTVTDSGSLWAVSGKLEIGFFQSDVTGRVTVANGGLVTVSGTTSLSGDGLIVLNGGAEGAGTMDVKTLDLSSGGSIAGDSNGILRINEIIGQPTNWTIQAGLQVGSTTHLAAAHWTLNTGESLTVDDGLSIGYNTSATFTQYAGAVQSRTFTLGEQATGHGIYTLSNGTLQVSMGLVGYHGTGELTICSGAMTCGNLYVADDLGSRGTVSLADGGFLFAQDLLVGQQGQGSFTQTGGTNITRNDLYVGYWTEGNGSITLSGGAHTVSNNAYIGGNNEGSTSDGGTGQYAVSAGMLTVGGTLYIGHDGDGTLSITNAGQVFSDSAVIGRYADANGQASVSGNDAVWNIANNLTVGYAGVGRLSLIDGGMVVADHIYLSSNSFLIGSGCICGDLTNAGTISPGFSVGILSITGSVELLSSSHLNFELSGTNAWEHDRMIVSDNMALGGTLTVSFDGYTPSWGDRFDLLDWDTLIPGSAFDTLDLPALPAGHDWYTNNLSVDGTLIVSLPLAWLESYELSATNDPFADPDYDWESTCAEYIADTNPTNGTSYFQIDQVDAVTATTVYFDSSSNRMYSLSGCTNMIINLWDVVPGAGSRLGVGGKDSLSDTNKPSKGPYYRIDVELP